MKLNPYIKSELKRDLIAKIQHEKQIVDITSAYDLTQEDKQIVFQTFPFLKTSDVRFFVDPNLIAGIIIKHGSQIIDLSLLNELQNLKKMIYEID